MASIRNSSSSTVVLMLFILFLHHPIHFAQHTKQDLNATRTRCIESEWKALIEFKGSLTDHYNVLSSWRGGECCSWYGITCHNHTGFVQSLDLSYLSYLGGKINSSLLNLDHLEYLDLSNTGFEGLPIPAFLGSFKNLQFLNLYNAGFRGEIPQQLGNMSTLQHLILGDDFFDINYSYGTTSSFLSSKSLNWITQLSSLETLQFKYINMSESFDWWDSVNMLSSLSSLTLEGCELTMSSNSYSYHVHNLTSLISLHLAVNPLNFVTFPPWLFNLTHLEDLDFSVIGLQGPIPSMFAKMTTLTTLNLQGNHLSREIPGELGYLTQLTLLDLSRNLFNSSIPSTFGQLQEMVNLDLSDNNFSGILPSTLGKLTKLQSLDVSKNSLIGELSESFFNGLKSLTELDVYRNQFLVLNVSSQWIPPFQILFLNLYSVFIGTQFPSWIQTQRNLGELILINASISGNIPDWCQTDNPNLFELDLSNNYFNGSLPTFDASLSYLKLSDNSISGNIPQELCNLKSLFTLSLANNQLTGRIPLCLGNLKELRQLDLGNNSLYGHIPNELGYLEKIEVLHLNKNKFFGKLPLSLQNLTSLRTLDLGDNELNGFIPAWIGKKFLAMQYLRLQSNHFSGQITVNLCQMSSLQILNLAQNNLIGTIPPCLGNLSKMLLEGSIVSAEYGDRLLNIVKGNELEYSSNLKYAKFISLSSNHLHGEIPDELMDLKGLQSLNLSNNDLSGRIPRKIGNLKHLESLDLSMNQISGTIPPSLVNIDVLSYLNLSFNNLTGRIPSANHFDTLYDPSVYEGNSGVCGKMLMRNCPGDLITSNKQNGPDGDNNEFEFSWFYGGMGTGFAIGLFGVLCLLYFNKSWRSAYFDFLENMYNRLWVAFAIKISQFRRKFN